jgi:pimeloyl-ACP methyl ester carboxylesterase
MRKPRYGPDNPDITYVPHRYPEELVDLGEVRLNIGGAGSADQPALLLIPGQGESWWGYEAAMDRLAPHFEVFAVDLRGQGRSSRTPGRYTLDNMGNDLVRLIDFRIRRPVVVAGLSSGGVLAAWLSAYAPPGTLRGAYYEDPPLFSSELSPECGPGMRQHVLSDTFALLATYLGDQWRVGDWASFLAAAETNPMSGPQLRRLGATPDTVPQSRKEYDPEWARAFHTGTVGASCDHGRMLRQVRCPVLLTHHSWSIGEPSGNLVGAMTEQQAARVQELVRGAGQPVEFQAFPQMPHNMHGTDPERYANLLIEWAARLPNEAETRQRGIFAAG